MDQKLIALDLDGTTLNSESQLSSSKGSRCWAYRCVSYRSAQPQFR